MTFRMVCPHDYCLFLIKDPPFLQIDIKAYQNMQSFAHLLAILLISAFFWPSQKCSFCGLTDRKKNDLNSLREIVSKHSFCMHVSFICRDLVIVHIIFKRGCLKGLEDTCYSAESVLQNSCICEFFFFFFPTAKNSFLHIFSSH